MIVALANASALANNLDPVSCNWNAQEMRGHLYNYFETGHFHSSQGRFPFREKSYVAKVRMFSVFADCQKSQMMKLSQWYSASPAKNGFMRLALRSMLLL